MNEQFMIMIAAMTPVEKIVEEIRNSAQEVLLFPDDKEKMQELEMHCMLFAINRKAEGTLEGAEATIKQFESHRAKLKLFEDTAAN